jgi:hypothetical protein
LHDVARGLLLLKEVGEIEMMVRAFGCDRTTGAGGVAATDRRSLPSHDLGRALDSQAWSLLKAL